MMFDMAQTTPPPPAPPIIVQRVQDHVPAYLIGFTAFGLDADLAKLEAAAASVKQPTGRLTTANGQLETVVKFAPETSRITGLKLYHDALSGKFGTLRIVAMIVSLKDAADGINFDTEVQMTAPEAIAE